MYVDDTSATRSNPLISIVTPVYNTPIRVLKECINSVKHQTYTNWQLCLVDDNSPNEECRTVIEKYARKDPRISFAFRQTNGGIVAASNDAVSLAKGEYIGLLDHDDVLEPDALELVIEAFRNDPQIDYVYTDEDLLDENGKLYGPFRKPDWSPERFRNQMYVCHFSVIRKSIIDHIGGFRNGFDGSQDYDLILRVSECARKIHHIPVILYHWRVSNESVASNPYAKPYAYDAGEKALQDHLDRLQIRGVVERRHDLPGNYKIVHQPSYDQEVEVLLLGTDQKVNYWGTEVSSTELSQWSIEHHSTYRNIRISQGVLSDSEYCSHFNQLMREASSEYVVVCATGIAISTNGDSASYSWCEDFLGFMEQGDLAMVAGYVWTPGSRLTHCVFSLGPDEIHHDGLRVGQHFTGPRAVFRSDREVSALFPYFAMIRKNHFLAVGGLDETLPPLWSWIDLCLRLRHNDLRVVSTPQVNAYQFSDDPEVVSLENARIFVDNDFRSRWGAALSRDPFSVFRPEQLLQRPALWKP